MTEKFILGIDVGGTNTDAALMSGREVVATAKRFTTADVRDGVIDAVTAILEGSGVPRSRIGAVMIGTTQFVNAFIQRRDLMPVAAIRVALPMGDGVPPFAGWPDDALSSVRGTVDMIQGGSYFNGRDYRAIDEQGVRRAARDAAAKGIKCFAISATFSPIRPDIEAKARAIVMDAVSGAWVTISSDIGGIGLLDRENAGIINASLAPLAQRVVMSLERAIADLSITAPVHISQNDGTLISTDVAARLPILTCSPGSHQQLSGRCLSDRPVERHRRRYRRHHHRHWISVAADFRAKPLHANYIGGVRTNLRMPDVLSIGVGGGSLVWRDRARWRVGPELGRLSLAERRLDLWRPDADIHRHRRARRPGEDWRSGPSRASRWRSVEAVLDDIHAQIEDAIDQVKVNAEPLPLIVVGGGNVCFSPLAWHLRDREAALQPKWPMRLARPLQW